MSTTTKISNGVDVAQLIDTIEAIKVDTNLAAFNDLRGETVSTLMSLALNLWSRAGNHDTLGRVAVEDVVESMIVHDTEHIDQLTSLA